MEKAPQPIKNFFDLSAWQEAHSLVIAIYRMTLTFPKEELFGLVSQMRRCAVSITSNIAEGFSRQSYKEKIQFYFISLGSTTELQDQLFITKDIGYISKDEAEQLYVQSVKVHKIINGLIKGAKKYMLDS